MATDLKQCPFCGGKAEYMGLRASADGASKGYVRCVHYCCEQTLIRSKNEAIEAWNERAEDGT